MCTIGLSGLSSVKPRDPTRPGHRGSHTTTLRELQRCTFERPGASNTTKILRKDPRREKLFFSSYRQKCGGEKGKKREITLRGSTLLGSTLRGPTLRGPHTLSSIQTSKNWPKSKLAENEIGRKRNWPKSKLAEVEIGRSRIDRSRIGRNRIGRNRKKKSWPKSKVAEVDRARKIAQLRPYFFPNVVLVWVAFYCHPNLAGSAANSLHDGISRPAVTNDCSHARTASKHGPSRPPYG